MMSSSIAKQASVSLLAVASAVAVTIGTGLWWLFRRPCKFLTIQDLPPTTVSNDNNIEVVRHLDDEERTALMRAFLPGEDMRYMVAGKARDSEVDQTKLESITSSLVGYFIAFCERYGHLLVCRDEHGTFLGAIGLIPPYASERLFTLHFYRTIIPLGLPSATRTDKDLAARFQAFAAMESMHKDLMKGIPHWYVQVVGVSERAQGKGVGKKLIQTAIDLAGGMPMYLDCNNGNVRFYEKVGFAVGKKIEISPKGIEDTSTLEMNGMTRGV